MPLDRSGQVPGTVSLKLERKLARPSARATDAVVGLAGGPGPGGAGIGRVHRERMAPALNTRDLLVFDQRGTGESGALRCPALRSFSGGSASQALEGSARTRSAPHAGLHHPGIGGGHRGHPPGGGYEKLVLYGTSYGTKVALEYAERYPQNVEALVLDSVVPTDGPEPFAVPTFQAIGPVLDEVCSDGACAGITSDPLGDIARLTAQLRKHLLSGSVYDGSGHRHSATLDQTGLLDILEAGDLNPALRALLPAAVQSALRHDPDPLLRLKLLSEGLIPSVPKRSGETPGSGESREAIDEALFVDTFLRGDAVSLAARRHAGEPARAGARGAGRAAERRLLPVRREHGLRQQPGGTLRRLAGRLAPTPGSGSAAGCRDADPLRRCRICARRRRMHVASRPRYRMRDCSSSHSRATRCSAATSAAAPSGR